MSFQSKPCDGNKCSYSNIEVRSFSVLNEFPVKVSGASGKNRVFMGLGQTIFGMSLGS